MSILSIQSQVVSGHVGNSAAVFALQRLGREVWPLPTTLLSHHPGHGGAAGGPVPAALQESLLDGMVSHGCFARCEAVLSGYLGHEDSAECVRRAAGLARAGTPGAIYLCDPVLGDEGRLYVRPEIVAAVRQLAAIADIVTPNAFELHLLARRETATRAEALDAMRILQGEGPGIVLLSSFAGADTPPGTLDLLLADGPAAWRLNIPDLGRKFHGAGDVLAALFLHAWLPGRDSAAALARAVAALQAMLAETAARGADELLLIPAQALLAAPPDGFIPEPFA